jgi:asparagine N-glycosylation enzyme membrane subunit Stt3
MEQKNIIKSCLNSPWKRTVIYLIIIILLCLWLIYSNDSCNFGGTGRGNGCGLVLLKIGVIIWLFLDLFIRLLKFIAKHISIFTIDYIKNSENNHVKIIKIFVLLLGVALIFYSLKFLLAYFHIIGRI